MIKIQINGKEREVAKGITILDALKKEGIEVPTMCFLENTEHFPTCMVCIVKDQQNGKFIPSCSTFVAPDMDIIDGIHHNRSTGTAIRRNRFELPDGSIIFCMF